MRVAVRAQRQRSPLPTFAAGLGVTPTTAPRTLEEGGKPNCCHKATCRAPRITIKIFTLATDARPIPMPQNITHAALKGNYILDGTSGNVRSA